MTAVTRGLPEVITAQTLFSKVATHLLTQGRPATSERGSCRYRSGDDNELSCAAGVLIPDDRYSKHLENRTVSSDDFMGVMPELREHKALLQDLQWAHDDEGRWIRGEDGERLFNKSDLRIQLEGIAEQYSLTMPEIPAEPATA